MPDCTYCRYDWDFNNLPASLKDSASAGDTQNVTKWHTDAGFTGALNGTPQALQAMQTMQSP
jgi:hypothetical protein